MKPDLIVAAQALNFEHGQYVYSKGLGPCVYLGVAHRSSVLTRTTYNLRLVFGDKDDDVREVPASEVCRIFKRDAVRQAVDIIKSPHEIKPLQSMEDIERTVKGDDLSALAELVRTLRNLPSQRGGKGVPRNFKTQYDLALYRLTAALTIYSLYKQSANNREAVVRQPSSTMPYFHEMRQRLEFALDGLIAERKPEEILGFQPRYANIFKHIAAKVAAARAHRMALGRPLTEPQTIADDGFEAGASAAARVPPETEPVSVMLPRLSVADRYPHHYEPRFLPPAQTPGG